MENLITRLIDQFGYWGVLLLIAVENLFPPIPSEVILTFGGFLTTYTAMRPAGVVLAATGGSVAGALVLYGVGRLLAPERLEKLLRGRVGQLLKLEADDVHKASGWFAAHGWPSVFYCRCIPILRSLISIPAGMAGMRLAPFLLLTTAGSTLWNILLVGAGALAGHSWPAISAALAGASAGVKFCLYAVCLAGAVFLFVRPGKPAKKERGDGAAAGMAPAAASFAGISPAGAPSPDAPLSSSVPAAKKQRGAPHS